MKLLYHPAVLEHLDSVPHPENTGRLQAFLDLPVTQTLPDALDYIPLIHPQDHIETIRSYSQQGLSLDPDTHTTSGSFAAATTAVSLAILAYKQGDFALGRPPGHHAYRKEAHGFCLFNQIAIATQFALQEHERVLILDFDGHLGDGTMDIFYQNNQVLYWSVHQYPAYPGNGAATEIGAGAKARALPSTARYLRVAATICLFRQSKRCCRPPGSSIRMSLLFQRVLMHTSMIRFYNFGQANIFTTGSANY